MAWFSQETRDSKPPTVRNLLLRACGDNRRDLARIHSAVASISSPMSDKNAEKYGSLESRSFQQILFFLVLLISRSLNSKIRTAPSNPTQPDILSSIVCDVLDNSINFCLTISFNFTLSLYLYPVSWLLHVYSFVRFCDKPSKVGFFFL